MALPGYTVTSGTHALAAATAETTWNIIPTTTVGIQIVEFGISFAGVTASAVPAEVDLCTSTQATAGTAGSSPTPLQIRGRTLAPGVTAGVAYSAEPTVLVPIKTWYVSPNGGMLVMQFPLGREMDQGFSSEAIKAIALRVTAPATVNCRSYVEFERI